MRASVGRGTCALPTERLSVASGGGALRGSRRVVQARTEVASKGLALRRRAVSTAARARMARPACSATTQQAGGGAAWGDDAQRAVSDSTAGATGVLLVLLGPHASGKSTICNLLAARHGWRCDVRAHASGRFSA